MASRMTIRTKVSLLTLVLFFTIFYVPVTVSASGQSFPLPLLSNSEAGFVSPENDQSASLRELSIDKLATLQIVQQPVENSNFVSPLQDYVTEFRTAANYGTFGLLAHNYLAGRYFSQISPGQKIELVYSDKKTKTFVVTEIRQYQALVPDSPSSDFIDLSTGDHLTALQLFNKVYRTQTGNLILQTCIAREQNSSWGRLFVIAKPVE